MVQFEFAPLFVKLRTFNVVGNRAAVFIDFQKGRMRHLRVDTVANDHLMKRYKHMCNTLGVAHFRKAEIASV